METNRPGASSDTAQRDKRRPPYGAPNVWVLAVIDGDLPNGVHRLARFETIIGRGDTAHVAIEDEEISKRHCLLRVEGPVCTIQDLGSLNGTWVNGRRLRTESAERLRHLDEIQVGTTRFFVLGGAFKPRAPMQTI
ncbi:MAG TPA: FHA domain-containing protein [Candidatus Polarisedimenticolaceae bacterium]|nr:FHA domain-containing protein [Candidatus Polarisedimenticolaceae bacterium]